MAAVLDSGDHGHDEPAERRPLRGSEEDLTATAALLRRCFDPAPHGSVEYLRWFYFRNPVGPVLLFDRYHGDTKVGQYAAIPQQYVRRGSEPLTVGLSVDTAVDPHVRLKRLFVELGTTAYDAACELGWAGVYGTANANSTPGFVKYLGCERVGKFPVRGVLAPWRRAGARRGLDVTAEALLGSQLSELLATIDFSPGERFSHQWDADLLRWRLGSPISKYSVLWDDNVVIVTTRQKLRFGAATVVLKMFARRGAPPRTSALSLVGYACRRDRTPLAVYAGYNARVTLPGVAVPRKVLPSPLNLLIHPLPSGLSGATFDIETIEFLDFDQY
jgi:hypothetical protein